MALFARKHLPELVKAASGFKEKDYAKALREAYLALDKLLSTEKGRAEVEELNKQNPTLMQPKEEEEEKQGLVDTMGCTACVALLTKSEVYVANIGDSRCVLCDGGKPVPMSQDHKPTNQGEMARIKEAGSEVVKGRVDRVLNLSRSFGDMEFKWNPAKRLEEQAVSPAPDVKVRPLTEGIEFLVLACDGVWNALSPKEAVERIRGAMMKGQSEAEIKEILESLLPKLVALGPSEPGQDLSRTVE